MQASSIINIPHYFVTISRLHKMQVDEPCTFYPSRPTILMVHLRGMKG